MGNIVTPEQGLLPLPDHSSAINFIYPWWLNTALAIWALAALFCCWLLLLLYLLRYCCRWCRHRKYAAERMSLNERFFDGKDRQNIYNGKDRYFTTVPSLTPITPYAINSSNEVTFHDVYESHSIHDDDTASAYVISTMDGVDNEMFQSSSELISEEEITNGETQKRSKIIRPLANRNVNENLRKNIHHNITKNFYIDEQQNYFVRKDSLTETPTPLHDQEIQRLPGPTITTVNMAAEHIADNPNWENANEDTIKHDLEKASSKIVTDDFEILNRHVTYKQQPDIYIHRTPTPMESQNDNHQATSNPIIISDDASITSEMSGHDSETIYETIRIFTPRKQPSINVDEDEYRTVGVDEVEIEMKDLIRFERHSDETNEFYGDLSISANAHQENIVRSRTSSISSSSTKTNLIPPSSTQDQIGIVSAEETEQQTVTETIHTRHIQNSFEQSTEHIQKHPTSSSALSAITHHQGQNNNEKHIIIPMPTSIVPHNSTKKIEHF